jgi:hypothetical protein
MKDWTVWMASIQTATIASVGFLAKESNRLLSAEPWQRDLAILVLLFNTFALFFSAWILTSLSSLRLRIGRKHLKSYDFYNFPLYAYMSGPRQIGKEWTVGFVALWNHCLWAAGILLFGALSLSFALR